MQLMDMVTTSLYGSRYIKIYMIIQEELKILKAYRSLLRIVFNYFRSITIQSKKIMTYMV